MSIGISAAPVNGLIVRILAQKAEQLFDCLKLIASFYTQVKPLTSKLMQSEIIMLMVAAVSIVCLHTASDPDHYLQFIALSKSRGWSFTKTIGSTIICGCGHVWSSVFLGLGEAGHWMIFV